MKEETKVSYVKEAYIKKKREQLDNAYKTIDEGLEEITTNPNFFKEYLKKGQEAVEIDVNKKTKTTYTPDGKVKKQKFKNGKER